MRAKNVTFNNRIVNAPTNQTTNVHHFFKAPHRLHFQMQPSYAVGGNWCKTNIVNLCWLQTKVRWQKPAQLYHRCFIQKEKELWHSSSNIAVCRLTKLQFQENENKIYVMFNVLNTGLDINIRQPTKCEWISSVGGRGTYMFHNFWDKIGLTQQF